MNIVGHLKSAGKLALGLIVLFAVLELINKFAGKDLKPYITSPLVSLGVV